MSNESENKKARRAEDKRADGAVDWTDAPRFTALGIAETWSVTVEAEGQRVLCISHEHVAGLDSEYLEPFVPTIRSCAQHLLGFIGAAPIAGNTAAVRATSVSAAEDPTGDLTDERTIYDLAAEHEANRDGLYGPVTFDASGLIDFARAIERAAIAAHLARQPKAEQRNDGPHLANAIAAIDRGEDDEGPETPGIYTREEVLDMLKYEIVTDSGARALRNGDGMEFNLGELALLANRSAHLARQAQVEPVAVVDEGDDGLFIDIIYGPDGSPLKCGDKLYSAAPVAPAGAQNAEAIRNQATSEVRK